MTKLLEQMIRRLAAQRCEYCLTPESLSPLPFVLDHIIAKQHEGETILENLALCCPWCNRHKGPNIAGIDPVSKAGVFLFNPRAQVWAEHFNVVGSEIRGLTEAGRTTVSVLKMNHPIPQAARLILIREGLLRFDHRQM